MEATENQIIYISVIVKLLNRWGESTERGPFTEEVSESSEREFSAPRCALFYFDLYT